VQDFGVDTNKLAVVRTLLKYCGGDRRVMDLFSDRSISSRFASLAKQHIKVGCGTDFLPDCLVWRMSTHSTLRCRQHQLRYGCSREGMCIVFL